MCGLIISSDGSLILSEHMARRTVLHILRYYFVVGSSQSEVELLHKELFLVARLYCTWLNCFFSVAAATRGRCRRTSSAGIIASSGALLQFAAELLHIGCSPLSSWRGGWRANEWYCVLQRQTRVPLKQRRPATGRQHTCPDLPSCLSRVLKSGTRVGEASIGRNSSIVHDNAQEASHSHFVY